MKTLLAIVNNPSDAKNFVRYIAQLSLDLRVNVQFMYIENPTNYPLGISGVNGIAAAQIQRNLQDKMRLSKDKVEKEIKDAKELLGPKLLMEYATELGIKSHIVKRLVEENKVQMVAIEGSKIDNIWGQTDGNLGVIHHANCPVWVIPYGFKYTHFNQIIYATDYKEEDVATLKKLILMTIQYAPQITALHFTSSIDFNEKIKKTGFQEMFQQKTAYKNLSVEAVKEEDNDKIPSLIDEFARHKKAELIVLLQENRNLLERLFRTNPTDEILKETNLPLLIFHEENARLKSAYKKSEKSHVKH